MENKEIREALEKQLQLLSKRSESESADAMNLVSISKAMCEIAELLMRRDPLGKL